MDPEKIRAFLATTRPEGLQAFVIWQPYPKIVRMYRIGDMTHEQLNDCYRDATPEQRAAIDAFEHIPLS